MCVNLRGLESLNVYFMIKTFCNSLNSFFVASSPQSNDLRVVNQLIISLFNHLFSSSLLLLN